MASERSEMPRHRRPRGVLLVLAALLVAPSAALAGDGDKPVPPPPVEKKAAPKAPPAPAAPALSCTLLTTEAPRGGRLEVEGRGFGKAPLVRIGGRVTRMIERIDGGTAPALRGGPSLDKIAVQIHADSDGGVVTVHAGKVQAACGTLTIIGKDG